MRLIRRLEKFEKQYETLVEYFTDSNFRFPEFLRGDLYNLLMILDRLKIDPETFLIANFRSYTPDEGDIFSYPFVRWLLRSPYSFWNYEKHHKLHGDKIGILNYTRISRYIRDMKQDVHIWLSMSGTDLEKIEKFAIGESSDVFKLYIRNRYFELLVENKINLNFHKNSKVSNIEAILPFAVLDRIFKEQEGLFLVGGKFSDFNFVN